MTKAKTFTTEEMSELRKSPYIKNVTEKQARFTAKFKTEFWRKYKEENKPPRQILSDMGLNPEIFGTVRIQGIQQHVREQAESGEFSDMRRTRAPDAPPTSVMNKVHHEIEFLKQEIEFIKKIILAERKAGR